MLPHTLPGRAKRLVVTATRLLAVLGGLALRALFGWWWADPVAALAMVPLLVREGVEGVRGRETCGCGDGCHLEAGSGN